MTKKLFILVFFNLLFLHTCSFAQNSCNRLGAWLWYIENTEFNSHAEIADSLAEIGVKRIYVKVADGAVDSILWPELTDKQLVLTYKSRNLDVWAWSYNYPGNHLLQAEALKIAASTGYEGFVVDVETEFNGDSIHLSNLFQAFHHAKEKARLEGIIDESFKLYCTTWGNPADHNFRVDVIDPYIDAFMPQTYVENWGVNYIENLEYWIEAGNLEFQQLGATKPLHHIVSLEKGIMDTADINKFIRKSGPETSVWRIPGGDVSMDLWTTWRHIHWNYNCNTTVGMMHENNDNRFHVYPIPATDNLVLENHSGQKITNVQIISLDGKIHRCVNDPNTKIRMNIQNMDPGIYILKISTDIAIQTEKIIIQN
jgi:hypothetical protein